MAADLYPHCIYTIVHPDRFKAARKRGRPTTLEERKRWVTAATLLARAEAAGQDLPVILANSTRCREILGWAVLRSIRLGEKSTQFTFVGVRAIKGRETQELVLRRQHRRIARGFIRPYALCVTPAFLVPTRTTHSRSGG